MKKLAWMSAAAALALSACGEGASENRCTSSLRNSLLNPETAEFLDFTKVETDEESGESAYSVRVRAEGQLGNTITKNYLCADLKSGECFCVPS